MIFLKKITVQNVGQTKLQNLGLSTKNKIINVLNVVENFF
jgi:hypothetical protein